MHIDADLARLSDVAAATVAALHLDGERRRRMAHRAGLGHRMCEVGYRQRRLRLAEALDQMVSPVCSFQKSNRSGLSASPAVVQYVRVLKSWASTSACIIMRYMVGGQHSVVTP